MYTNEQNVINIWVWVSYHWNRNLQGITSATPLFTSSLVKEDLPLLGELNPNHLHEVTASSKEEVEGAVGVVEPVQQHLRHLSLLLSDQPETSTVWLGVTSFGEMKTSSGSKILPLLFLISPLPGLVQNFQKLRLVSEKKTSSASNNVKNWQYLSFAV